MKKLIMLLISVVMIFSLTACGGSEEKADGNITLEQYKELAGKDWPNMDREAVEKFLGVKGETNEEDTKERGEGYEAVIFKGPDKKSNLYVLFGKKKDGTWGVISMSPTGSLIE